MALYEGIVGYWSLDEASGNAIDSMFGRDLTDINSVGAAAGLVSGCRQFTGASQHRFSRSSDSELSIPNLLSSYNFAFWAQITSTSGQQTFIAKRTGTGIGASLEYLFRADSGQVIFYWGSGGSFGTLNSGFTMTTNTWTFIQGGFDASISKFFISVNDGTVTLTGTVSTAQLSQGNPFQFGGIASSEFLTGKMDEVVFVKRRFSAAEVTDLYNGGAGRDFTYFTSGRTGTDLLVTQDLVNAIASPVNDIRVTQDVVNTVASNLAPIRVTQDTVTTVVKNAAPIRTTQMPVTLVGTRLFGETEQPDMFVTG